MRIVLKKYSAIFVLISFVLSACAPATENISMRNICVSDVKATVSSAYYLDTEGVLFCTGVDTDASSYVLFLEKDKGVVAKNVRSFDEMAGGGYYINSDNELYMWNEQDFPLYNYKKETHTCVAKNILFAKFGNRHMIYIDANHDLYLAGEFNKNCYSIQAPKLIAQNVSSADINDGIILYAKTDDGIFSFGSMKYSEWEDLQKTFPEGNVSMISIEKDYIAFLIDKELWFWGDYRTFAQSTEKGTSLGKEFQKLKQNISAISTSSNAILAMDTQGTVFLWGKYLANDAEKTDIPEYKLYEGYRITENAKSIYLSGCCLCFVDQYYKSNIFHASGWVDLYGNSTKDTYVGINREPVIWQ